MYFYGSIYFCYYLDCQWHHIIITFIGTNYTNATVDNGAYTYEVTVTIASVDTFQAASNATSVVLNGKVYYFFIVHCVL